MRKIIIFITVLAVLLVNAGCNGIGQSISIEDKFTLDLKPYEALKLNINTKYADTPFASDKNDHITYVVNAMWDKFGLVNDGTNAVHKFGNEPTWFEWNAMKIMWFDSESDRKIVKDKIVEFPITEDGYLWSWGTSPHWPVPAGGAYHFDGNFRYINAVYEVIAWENSLDFLKEVDTTTAVITDDPNTKEYNEEVEEANHAGEDASKGKTVREKLDLAMKYILENLNGKNGLIIIDNGRNTGKFGADASSYWDNYPTGYKDAYLNLLFPNALTAMAEIERMCGNTDKVDDYLNLAETAKKKYVETFWDKKKGRFINTIDIDGVKHDYGLTFQNIKALYYGIADNKGAKSIYSWINGTRTIEGDTSTGKDIYEKFKIAPRSNTVAIESLFEEVNGKKVYWWHGPNSISVNYAAKYGIHQTNGGVIFYTSYYDLMSRIKFISPDSALNRLNTIASEYEKDELMRDPVNSKGAAWIVGVIEEFPESGLVPMSYLYGFMGIRAGSGVLNIKPSFPTVYNSMSVKHLHYGGKSYHITLDRKKGVTISYNDGIDMKVNMADFISKGAYTATVFNENGEVVKKVEATKVEDSYLIDLKNAAVGKGYVTIE